MKRIFLVLLFLIISPFAMAGDDPTTKPLAGSFSGVANFLFDGYCDDLTGVPFHTVTDAVGKLARLLIKYATFVIWVANLATLFYASLFRFWPILLKNKKEKVFTRTPKIGAGFLKAHKHQCQLVGKRAHAPWLSPAWGK